MLYSNHICCHLFFYSFIDDHLKLEQDIYNIIAEGLTELQSSQTSPTKKNKGKGSSKNSSKKSSEVSKAEVVENHFLKQKPFQSLLPTVNLFLEQEPISGVAMNLDVNYRHVIQDNYFKQGETEKTRNDL